MSNTIQIKDWMLKHADMIHCELVLDLSDAQITAAIKGCDSLLQAADVLFKLVDSLQ